MARQPDIRYIHIYTDGSAARKIEPEYKPKKKAQQPKPRVRRKKKMVIYLDPLSVLALMSTVLLAVAMTVGMIQWGNVRNQTVQLEEYVDALQAENAQLHMEYKAGYDLDEIEQKALAMGLVPAEQVEHVSIHVQIPEADAQPTFWERLGAFWTELFSVNT